MKRPTHCWAGATDGLEIGSQAWAEMHARFPDGATCMLESGHDGPHIYTPDNEIIVTFKTREEKDA